MFMLGTLQTKESNIFDRQQLRPFYKNFVCKKDNFI